MIMQESKLHITISQMIKSHTTTKEHKTLVEEAKALRDHWKQYLQGTETTEEKKKGVEDAKEKKGEKVPAEVKLGHTISTGEISQIGNLVLLISRPIESTRSKGFTP